MTPSRETDDQAIEALCFLLDHQQVGEQSELGSRSGLDGTRGELWSMILRRRLVNVYQSNRPAVSRAQWMHRHYHLRLLAYPDEGAKKSAAQVAQKWHDAEDSVRTNASREAAKSSAEDWIKTVVTNQELPFFDGYRAPIDYGALEAAVARLAAEFLE